MGHRDIWGKDSKKWKKWCPCFDAEAEYANIDQLIKQSKVEEAPKPIDLTRPDRLENIRKLAPWNKTN